jgi:hypothetical protein
MADIWPVYEGREPTRGEPWLSLPLEDAIALFELKPLQFISDSSRTSLPQIQEGGSQQR